MLARTRSGWPIAATPGIGDEQRARHAEALELPAGVGGGAGAELDRRRLQREDRSRGRSRASSPADGSVPEVTDRLVEDLAAAVGDAPRARRRRPPRALRGRLDAALPRPGARRRAARPTPSRSSRCSPPAASTAPRVVPQGGNTGLVGAGVPARRRGRPQHRAAHRRSGPSTAPPRRSRPGAGVTLARAAGRTRAPPASTPASTSARATAPPSAAWSPPTPAAPTPCATGRSAPASPGCRRCSPTARSSTGPALLKDNAGYDLAGAARRQRGHARASSPRVRWRLVPRLPEPRRRAHPAARRSTRPPRCWPTCARACPRCDAADFFLDEGLQLVLDHLGLPAPVPDARARLRAARVRGHERPDRRAGRGAGAGRDRGRASWPRQRRARAAVALARGAHRGDLGGGVPHKMDVGVPLARLAEFADRVREEVARLAPDARR